MAIVSGDGDGDGDPAAGLDPDYWDLPSIPVSAGALIFDRGGRLLILKPTYKPGWTIPGGVMEADGETPWQACQREVREECGSFGRTRLAAIAPQPEEIAGYRLADLAEALSLLRGPIRRRVRAACAGRGLVYLEDGRPVEGVRPRMRRPR